MSCLLSDFIVGNLLFLPWFCWHHKRCCWLDLTIDGEDVERVSVKLPRNHVSGNLVWSVNANLCTDLLKTTVPLKASSLTVWLPGSPTARTQTRNASRGSTLGGAAEPLKPNKADNKAFWARPTPDRHVLLTDKDVTFKGSFCQGLSYFLFSPFPRFLFSFPIRWASAVSFGCFSFLSVLECSGGPHLDPSLSLRPSPAALTIITDPCLCSVFISKK